MRLYSYDDHAEVADFQPGDGSLRTYRRSVAPNRTSPLAGHYATLDRKLAVLYREGGRLRFFLEGSGSVPLDDTATVSWKLVSRNKAQLTVAQLTVAQPTVEPPTVEPPEVEPLTVVYRSSYNRVLAHIAAAPGTTREDLDFGLYVANVVKDEQRRAELYV